MDNLGGPPPEGKRRPAPRSLWQFAHQPGTRAGLIDTITEDMLSGAPSLGLAAECYAGTRWPVFPLKPRGKEPLFRRWPERASIDRVRVGAWWDETPDANIGFIPGLALLYCLDVDGVEAERAARQAHLFDDTDLIVRTGRPGGWHLYFLHPMPGRKIGNGNLPSRLIHPDIDQRCDSGYTLLPPSIHPVTGRHYIWTHTGEPGALPEWIRRPLEEEAAARIARGTQPIEAGWGAPLGGPRPYRGAAIPVGQRNQTLLRIAGSLRGQGESVEAIRAHLHHVNATRCEAPSPEVEIEGICRAAEGWVPGSSQPKPSRAKRPRMGDGARAHLRRLRNGGGGP